MDTDDTDDLRHRMQRLPRIPRMVIHLHYLDGIPLDEVAFMVGVDAGECRAMHDRALYQLRSDVMSVDSRYNIDTISQG